MDVYRDYFYLVTKSGYDSLSGAFYLLMDTTIELEMKLTTYVPDKYPGYPVVYPVPADEVLMIEPAENIMRIELYNLLGEALKIVEFNNVPIQIDITGLENGMYIVSMIMKDNMIIQQKIIKCNY